MRCARKSTREVKIYMGLILARRGEAVEPVCLPWEADIRRIWPVSLFRLFFLLAWTQARAKRGVEKEKKADLVLFVFYVSFSRADAVAFH